MKRAKLRKLIAEVQDYDRIAERPVTVDTLSIDFDARTVTFRGRTITPEHKGIVFPVLSTDRLIIPKGGEVL